MEPTPALASPASRAPLPRHDRRRRFGGGLLVVAAASTLAVVVPGATAHAGTLPSRPYLVSRDASGAIASEYADFSDLSGNGRFVVFVAKAPMVPGDGNAKADVYVKDRWSGSIERVSVSSTGAEANGDNGFPTISDDGNRIAFQSQATNLGGTNALGFADIYVRDRKAGTTTRASVSTTGGELGAASGRPKISGNGRFVTFDTAAANAVAGDSNATSDVFLRDLQTSTTDRVSITSSELQSSVGSLSGAVSDDGRFVAFTSGEELAGGQASDSAIDVYVRDRTAGTTVNAHVSSAEAVAIGGNGGPPEISGNGQYVVFSSAATNLVASDTNAVSDVFRRDLVNGVTTRVSLHDADTQLAKDSYPRDVTDDGNQVLFESDAPATAATDAGTDRDAFVRTISTASTRRISTSPVAPDPGNNASGSSLSDDGAASSYEASGTSYVANPTTHVGQVYVSAPMELGPFTSTATFIDQQYVDFVGRTATNAERADWQARLLDGRATPSSLIATLAGSSSFSSSRGSVVRLYWAFFLRKPDPGGLTYWLNKYEGGMGLSVIAQKFAQSSEFTNRYGSLTNQQFVKLIYPNIFERQPDPSGLAYWTGKLDSKAKTRGDVIVGFSESSEGKRRLAPQVFITLISQGMLRVSPSATYWDAAFPVFKAGEKELAWLAQTTLLSPGYAARF
jgi:hypothetical protein